RRQGPISTLPGPPAVLPSPSRRPASIRVRREDLALGAGSERPDRRQAGAVLEGPDGPLPQPDVAAGGRGTAERENARTIGGEELRKPQWGTVGWGAGMTWPRASMGSRIAQYWRRVVVGGPRVPAVAGVAPAVQVPSHCMSAAWLARDITMEGVFSVNGPIPA